MNEGRLKFFKLVKEMRAEQKRYFASRSHDALVNARMLEQRVDEEISRGDRYLSQCNQPSLFAQQ